MHKKWSFPLKNFFSKYDQIRSFLQIWSHLVKKFLMENLMRPTLEITVLQTISLTLTGEMALPLSQSELKDLVR